MFKKSFFSFMLIIILSSSIFLIGCASRRAVVGGIGGFLGGTTGLKVNVMEGAPPSVVQAGGAAPFSVIVPLENLGESPVGPGTNNTLVLVRLAGIMYNNWGLTPATAAKTLDVKIESAKRNFDGSALPGEINYISFDNLVYKPNLFESISLPIRVEACYDYESYATTQFCMKKDIIESREDSSICMMRGPRPVGSSGAPIHITSVEEAPISNQSIQLNMVIEHLGNGIFFSRADYKDFFDACAFTEMNPSIYKVEVFVEPVQKDTYDINCLRLDTKLPGGGVSGFVRMFEGAPVTLSCFITRNKPMSVRVYTDLLNIRLRYRYGEFIEIPVLIQGHP
jgi:hypothetical protein